MAGRAMLADWGGSSGNAGSASLNLMKNLGGGGRIASAPEPVTGQVQGAANGRSVSPSEPLQAQVRIPTGGTQPYAVARQQALAPRTAAATAAPAPAPYVAQAPAAPRGPAQGGRQAYEAMDAGARAQTDADWLGGDSDYTAQLGEYQRALDDFVSRIAGQKKNFEDDRVLAQDANGKNQTMSTNQLGEDFGARGMSYSGLWDKSKNDLMTRFSEQGKNIDLVAQRNSNEADNREKDYRAENSIGQGNAKRSALARMAAQQSIIDSNASMF